ncbi:MAG: hypothetical protein IPF41_17390 [Flavobacteriales bacterium]|nr:hypothetical protein [Flavobacteriales bacterium]
MKRPQGARNLAVFRPRPMSNNTNNHGRPLHHGSPVSLLPDSIIPFGTAFSILYIHYTTRVTASA